MLMISHVQRPVWYFPYQQKVFNLENKLILNINIYNSINKQGYVEFRHYRM